MSDALLVDYDALAGAYVDNLHTALRNFSQGPAFLEGWAHDEDHVRSLVNMFEAARDAGLAGLEVKVGPGTLARLDRGGLEVQLRELGRLRTRPEADGTAFRVDFSTR
ncbi:MAG: hypothetical protein ACRD09_02020 [Vicinamibacterales bacterium]